MARTPRWMQGQVRSYKEATRRVFNLGSQGGCEAGVLRYWQKIRPLGVWFDSLRIESERIEDGANVKFARAGLLLFYVAALVLKRPMTEAYTFVQESRTLRKLLHDQFGWPEPSEETLARIAAAKHADEVSETGFPSRKTVMNLFDWIERWAGEDVIDERTGEITRHVSLDTLEQHAYTKIPVEIARRYGLDLSRVAIDSKRIKSPRRRNRGQRPDKGAGFMGRSGEKAMFGRPRSAPSSPTCL